MPRTLLAPVGLFALLAVACGSGATGTAGGGGDSESIAVSASDDACEVSQTELAAGQHTLRVTNDGSQVTEVYVYGEDDKIMGEVENVGPGISRDFTVRLAAGDYEVACKPGQTGDGLRTALTVTGEGGEGDSEVAYDREVEVTATDFTFSGLEDFTAVAGEAIEFKLENDGATPHELEIFGPDGEELGEIGSTPPGEDGEAILVLLEPGTYRYTCGIDDHEERGMVGEFEVTAA